MSFISKLRSALVEANKRYAQAMDQGNEDVAIDMIAAREYILNMLVREIQADDPYTTEADIRYYEEVRAG